MSKLKCCGCKDRFPEESMIDTPVGKFHSRDCQVDYAVRKGREATKRRLAKVKVDTKKKEKIARKQHREDKERIRTRAEWYDTLQTLVNQYVMHVRDVGEPCCTCGTTNPAIKYDAGHHLSRGARKELRFELTNIHKQCSVNCNQWGSSMRPEYKEFIIQKYGQEHYAWLIGPHPMLKEQFPHYLDIKAEILRYRKLLRDNRIKPYA